MYIFKQVVEPHLSGGIEMAFPEYQLSEYQHVLWIRDSHRKAKWLLHQGKQAAAGVTLEEEIYLLRLELERLAAEESCLTSPRVVESSMRLDEKINEYMNRKR
jgi:hypothetical protein